MLKVKNTEIEKIIFNDTEVDTVIYNGVTVFELEKKETITMQSVKNVISLMVFSDTSAPLQIFQKNTETKTFKPYITETIDVQPYTDIVLKGKAITAIYCHETELTTINVSACHSLKELHCDNNRLTALNVSGCKKLEKLYCSNNRLAALNVVGCKQLERLYCDNNHLTALNVSGCKRLQWIDCKRNKLTETGFKGFFKSLANIPPQSTNNSMILYEDYDFNFKQFTWFEEFRRAKWNGWRFYYNYFGRMVEL